ncbi:MAG: 16S rRNA (adenine(1518)-N(6)/adenine(1519)-N(6))-dimethyltransferase RsmA [Ruminococcus sp.]|jgi:16S rRNA (adenine1518-N6/adenine1519-N6)-dimethyltransferase|nr:16S rRNA (adenine(1518)-N(6)/adenine(1519)-N(6))-dimethyltransferase RsmA [Ruminococcus sp.]
MNLTDLSVIRSIQAEFGFEFSKGLGQNFLINPSVAPKIAEQGSKPESGVIEIGAGFGVLTKELCSVAKKVVCIELDRRLIPVLKKTVPYDNLTVINADILKCDLSEIILTHFSDINEITVCANLPYYITSPVIMKLLESRLPLESITVMVQKEAALRLCARCGTRESGAVTYAVSYYAKPEILFNVSRGSFFPPPNVDSAVIKLTLHKTPPIQVSDEDFLFALIKAAFSKRRKTFVNSVSMTLAIPKEAIVSALRTAGISPDIRPEKLTLSDFGILSDTLKGCIS